MTARQLQRLKPLEDERSVLIGQMQRLCLRFVTDEEVDIVGEHARKRDTPDKIKSSAEEMKILYATWETVVERLKAACRSRMLTRQNKNFS